MSNIGTVTEGSSLHIPVKSRDMLESIEHELDVFTNPANQFELVIDSTELVPGSDASNFLHQVLGTNEDELQLYNVGYICLFPDSSF
jgi:hypothetical protein